MVDLSIATLNMQVIALGVFFGMLTAWLVRWGFLLVLRTIAAVIDAAYEYVYFKYRDYQKRKKDDQEFKVHKEQLFGESSK